MRNERALPAEERTENPSPDYTAQTAVEQEAPGSHPQRGSACRVSSMTIGTP